MADTSIPDWVKFSVEITDPTGGSDLEYFESYQDMIDGLKGGMVLLSAEDLIRIITYPPQKPGESNHIKFRDEERDCEYSLTLTRIKL